MSRPGNDLVADAEQQGGVEDVVRERDRRSHRDRVAREQAHLHAGQALRDAVAHRRHAAGDLRGRAEGVRGLADDRREALVRLVRREHVVVGGDDADVGRARGDDAELVGARQGGGGVRQIGAAEAIGAARPRQHGIDPRQVGAPRRGASLADAAGDFDDGRLMQVSMVQQEFDQRPAATRSPPHQRGLTSIRFASFGRGRPDRGLLDSGLDPLQGNAVRLEHAAHGDGATPGELLPLLLALAANLELGRR